MALGCSVIAGLDPAIHLVHQRDRCKRSSHFNHAVNVTLTVPTGVVVNALFRANLNSGGAQSAIFTSLIEADQAPNSTGLADIITPSGGTATAANIGRLTNTSAQIGQRSTNAGSSYSVFTYGWDDNLRQ